MFCVLKYLDQSHGACSLFINFYSKGKWKRPISGKKNWKKKGKKAKKNHELSLK